MTGRTPVTKRRIHLHPVLMMMVVVFAAMVLTHLVPAGSFDRHEKRVIAGSYQEKAKVNGVPALLSATAPAESDSPAKAAGVVALFAAIPTGFAKNSNLIFMVMFVGGVFGILRSTGAIEAGIDRLLHLATGNAFLLTAVLFCMLASGATFLGLYSEYLAIIPLVLTLAQKLRLPNLFAPAVVLLAAGVGYSASVTNPIVLGVAQPLAGVPLFSGMLPRLLIFIAMVGVSLAYLFFHLRKIPKSDYIPEPAPLAAQHVGVLVALVAGAAGLVIGTAAWSWGTAEHAAFFLAWAPLLAVAGRSRADVAADAFVDGMKFMMLPCVMIGVAGGVAVILQSSQVLDSVVHSFAIAIEGHSPGVVAAGIMGAEMLFDLLIHSTGAKAAVSLPILAPIAQLSGVHGNVAVSALLLGGSITNLITPTNGILLAFLAAAKVDYLEWARFVAPLIVALCIVAFVSLQIMVMVG